MKHNIPLSAYCTRTGSSICEILGMDFVPLSVYHIATNKQAARDQVQEGAKMNGFYLTVGNKAFFLKSNSERKSKKTTQRIIQEIGKYRGFCPEMIERCMNDAETVKRIQYDTDLAVLERVTTSSGYMYYTVKGKNFQVSFPPEDFEDEVIVFS